MTTESFPNDAATDEPSVDTIDEQLVAYLDGELQSDERLSIEQRLVDDAQLRDRLKELQGGWQLLDELPQATVDERFTQTTLEMVAADVKVRQRERSASRRHWLRMLSVLIATVSTAALGAMFVYFSRQVRLRRQLADLPIVEHLDAYLAADDLQWLTQVSQNERWLETVDAAEAAGGFGPAGLPPASSQLSQASVEQRVQVVPQLDPAERSRLDLAWQRFENLPSEKQAEVRRRAELVAAAEAPGKLLRTMEAYARLRSNWSMETRTAIDSGTPEQRDRAFLLALARSRELWLRQLSDEDSEAIYQVLHVVAEDWLQLMLSESDDTPPWWGMQVKSFLSSSYQEKFADREAAVLHFVFVRRRGNPVLRLSDDDLFAMKSVVSAPVREALDILMPTPQMQKEVLYGWAVEAVRRKTHTARIESLLALDPEDRLDVELSPPHELFPLLERKSREDQPRGPSANSPRRGGRF